MLDARMGGVGVSCNTGIVVVVRCVDVGSGYATFVSKVGTKEGVGMCALYLAGVESSKRPCGSLLKLACA
jgi:hypothetical protein